MIQQTLLILKPCCIQRAIIGNIISRFENKGLKISAIKITILSKEKAKTHYHEHEEKDYFANLVDYITSGPVILIVLEGENAINLVRKIAGSTLVDEALPGTIRGDYVMHTPKNIVHTSDSEINAKREIELFFNKNEIIYYQRDIDKWI